MKRFIKKKKKKKKSPEDDLQPNVLLNVFDESPSAILCVYEGVNTNWEVGT